MKPLTVDYFGGLATQYAPLTEAKFRHKALVSENVNYDKGDIEKALGYTPVLENAVGATQIDDFESGAGWTGGSLESGTDEFVEIEAAADGTMSRSLSQAGVGTATMSKGSLTLDLGTNLTDIFHLWRRPLALPSTITGYQIRLRLETSSGNHYETVIAGTGSDEEALELGFSLYKRVRRHLFTKTGSPDWTNITLIQVDLEVTAGTGTINVTFDNLYWSAGYVQDLFQFRRHDEKGIRRKDEYAVAGGVMYRNDGSRWVSVYSGFDYEAQVNSFGSLDRWFVSDGKTSPQKIMADGTVFRMGIANPPKQIVVESIANGLLATQDVFVLVKFYSKTTGIESGLDGRLGGTKVTLTGSDLGVRVSNIPVSTDPQVTHVRLYFRPENLSSVTFFRGSADIDGEVPNGTTTFDFLQSITEIELYDDLDEDTDFPAYLDKTETPDPLTGDVVTATVNTLTLDVDAPTTDNELNGEIIKITVGKGAGQTRRITDYDGTTKIAILGSDWSITPDNTSEYATVPIEKSTQKEAFPLFFTEHAGYAMSVFAQRPWIMRFSRFRQPEYWALDDEITMGENDNDKITGMSGGRETSLVFKRDAVIPVSSVGEPTGLLPSPSISERGSVNHKGIYRIREDVWFPNENGIYWADAALRIRHASYEAQRSWPKFWDTRLLEKLVGVELRERFQYLLLGHSLGAVTPNRAWVTNYPNREGGIYPERPVYDISIHTHGADAAAVVEDVADIHRTWIALDGMVFQLDRGTSRDGRGFKMRHRTGLWSPGRAGDIVCRWPWIEVVALEAGDHDLSVDYFFQGGITADGTSLADLQGQSAVLGSFVLGTSKLGEGNYVYKRLRTKPRRSRFLMMEFSHDGRAEVQISAVTVRYQPTTLHGNF